MNSYLFLNMLLPVHSYIFTYPGFFPSDLVKGIPQRGWKDIFCITLGNNRTEVVLLVVLELCSLLGLGQKRTTCKTVSLPLGDKAGKFPRTGVCFFI